MPEDLRGTARPEPEAQGPDVRMEDATGLDALQKNISQAEPAALKKSRHQLRKEAPPKAKVQRVDVKMTSSPKEPQTRELEEHVLTDPDTDQHCKTSRIASGMLKG